MMFVFPLILLLLCLHSTFGTSPCGEDLRKTESYQRLKHCGKFCYCNGTFASCVEHHNNLTYIPKLGNVICMLNFSSNSLINVTQLTFKNVSNLQLSHLWLRNNEIRHISADAFGDFSGIEVLDLSSNSIFQSELTLVIYSFRNKSTSLRCLTLKKLNLSAIDKEFLTGIQNVKELHLTDNCLQSLDFSIWQDLKKLNWLDLSYNKLTKIIHIYHMKINILKLKSNLFEHFPEFCKENKIVNLVEIDISRNNIKSLTSQDFRCLPYLRVLWIIKNKLKEIKSNTFSSLSSLHQLSLDHVFRTSSSRISGYAFNNSAVVTIFMENLQKTYINETAFKGCTNLKKLCMSKSLLKQTVNDKYLTSLFGNLTTLRVLILDECQLFFFPVVISVRLINIERLSLNNNYIRTLPVDAFNKLKNLTSLSLGSNGIVNINSDVFPYSIRNQLKVINLVNNSFTCNCNNLWLINWLKRDFKKFHGRPNEYKCVNSKTLMKNAILSELVCSTSKMFPFIISVSGAIFIVLLISSIVYRWRWYIRHYIYLLRYKKRNQQLEVEAINFDFDAFVLFCDDDFRWVRDLLMPKIEEEGGLRLCIHQRDFTPGKYIVDNIIDSLDSSRKVVLVLSNNFNKSQWCEFELALVQTRALKKQEGYLVVILLEDMETRNMTSSLFALMQTITYIMWPEEQENRDLFWDRVRASIEH